MRPADMRSSAGFSLIEVLVAIVILAIALLGMAGLTAASMRGNNTAFYRSQATVLADDILDRMRSNVGPARGGQYNIAAGPVYVAGPGTMALFDCEEWVNLVGTSLPGGIGTVSVLNDVATIRISWDEGENTFTTVSQL
jgi:type IV pilus assembly protein PilV